jgi:hypothetical protein
MNVYLLYIHDPPHSSTGGIKLAAIFLTKALATKQVYSNAASFIESTMRFDQGRGEYSDMEIHRPYESRIEVRGKRWGSSLPLKVIRVWNIEEHEVIGDVVSALAAVSE